MMSIFETEVEQLSGRTIPMGTEEYLLQKSKAEGEHKKAVEMAHKLIAKGMPINEISELTGLSIKEIQSL